MRYEITIKLGKLFELDFLIFPVVAIVSSLVYMLLPGFRILQLRTFFLDEVCF